MAWKPAYLIHGDDHGRVAERRAAFRRRAEDESGSGGVEIFEGETSSPEQIVLALSAMTFAMGRRFLLVDGVERWKDADIKALVAPALATIAPETTIAFFGRDEGKANRTPGPLADAVRACGGAVATEETLKPRDLPRWLVGEAQRLGITLDGAAAQTLVGLVGDRQQRLLRELETLALEHGAGARIGVEEVEATAAPSAERQVWGFVDAIVGGDRDAALRAYLELREQGESLPRLIPLMARRVRDVLAVATRLEAGESPQAIKGTLRMSPFAADRRIREARGADVGRLRRATEALADLELASRGLGDLAEDTAAIRAIDAIAA